MNEEYRAPLTKDYMSRSDMSQTEKELLTEYQRLARSLSTLSQAMNRLSSVPTPQILDTLRTLESKTALVSTLLKASVYSMFVQNEQEDGEEENQDIPDYSGQDLELEASNTYQDGDYSITGGY